MTDCPKPLLLPPCILAEAHYLVCHCLYHGMDAAQIPSSCIPACIFSEMIVRACLAPACRAGFHDKVRGLQARLNSMQGAIDRANVAIEAKQRAEDDIRKDLEIARLEAENAQAERVGAVGFWWAACSLQSAALCISSFACRWG